MSVAVRLAPLTLLIAMSTSCVARHPPVSSATLPREAMVDMALRKLRGDAGSADVGGAATLLRQARALYAPAREPLVLGATLRLVAEPAHRGLVVLGYPSIAEAADAAPGLLVHSPTAV